MAERQEAEEAAEEDPTPTFEDAEGQVRERSAREDSALKEQAQALRDQTRALLAGREPYDFWIRPHSSRRSPRRSRP